MTNALAPRAPQMATSALEDPERLGNLLAASGYFQDTRDAAQAVVKVLAGAELGFGPIASMTGINIIKGRVTMSAFLMAATVKRHPKYDFRVREHSAQRAIIEFLEGGKTIGESEFTADMAKRAKLTGENWQKYPENMLFWRAMSNGAKFFCPDAFAGAPVYTPDELGADVDDAGDLVGAMPAPPPAPVSPASPGVREAPAPPAPVEPVPAPTSPGAEGTPATEGGDTGGGASSREAEGAPSAPSANGAPPDPVAVEPVTTEDVHAFMRMVEVHAIPENVWRAALLVNDAERLEDLPRGEFDALVRRVSERAARS